MMQLFESRKSLLALVAIGSIFGGVCSAQNPQFNQIREKMAFDSTPVKSVNGVIASYAPALQNATPAVVTIFSESDPIPAITGDESADPREELLRRLLGIGGGGNDGRRVPGQSGLGSGVILSPDGYILTNNHVVEGADRINVTLKGSKRRYSAELIGGDKDTDVALIKIDAKGLTPMQIGDSSNVQVGDVVLAVGNPLGLEQTVTQGIVSALGRRELGITGREGYENFIQTDASINVGNSGGALIDAEGRLIGMNTAIKTDGLSRGNVGIAFAIPSNMALNIVRKLVDGGGKVRRGFLGVKLQDLSVDKAAELKRDNLKGALVEGVNEGTPAEIAGLNVGDLIVEIDRKPVVDSAQLRLYVSSKDPGNEVSFKVIRGRKPRNFSVVLGDKDKLLAKINVGKRQLPQFQGSDRSRRQIEPTGGEFLDGVELNELDQNLRSALRADRSVRGVFVSSVQEGSQAAQAGLEAGQIITQIDQQNVGSVREAIRTINGIEGNAILLQIYKDGIRSMLMIPAQ